MFIHFEDRPSDSTVVDRVWRSRSERAGAFHSMATCVWVMVVTRHEGRTFLTVRGPETRATIAELSCGGRVGRHRVQTRHLHARDAALAISVIVTA